MSGVLGVIYSDEFKKFLSEDDEEDNILILGVLSEVACYNSRFYMKNPVHIGPHTGNQIVHNMLNGHYRQCYDMCRMMPDVFIRLCNLFEGRGLLKGSINVSVQEQMRIFLQTIGHGHKNRVVQHNLQHSGYTISHYFNEVLEAVCSWAPEIIRPKESLHSTPKHIIEYGGGKYYPFFKDCIGALDGTHIHAIVKKEEHLAYRSGRDAKNCTQNIMAVCDFHMRFTFKTAGWEGTTHDCRVLNHAIGVLGHNFPFPPREKYYLVDAGYPNRNGFLAPYRNTRYHLPEFLNVEPRGKEELFNSYHSSLRNIIERSFGVLKKRWTILNRMSPFSFEKQVKIVVACVAIHNFIIEQRIPDEFIQDFENEDASTEVEEHLEGINMGGLITDETHMGLLRNGIRDELALSKGVI